MVYLSKVIGVVASLCRCENPAPSPWPCCCMTRLQQWSNTRAICAEITEQDKLDIKMGLWDFYLLHATSIYIYWLCVPINSRIQISTKPPFLVMNPTHFMHQNLHTRYLSKGSRYLLVVLRIWLPDIIAMIMSTQPWNKALYINPTSLL